MLQRKSRFVSLLLVLILFSAVMKAGPLGEESPTEKEKRMRWWTEARLGMFIHWGLYALPARHEWVKKNEQMDDQAYRIYFDLFDPDLFQPGEWARLARKAGMKYMVITAKHHEGFCLWDSKFTDYKSTNTPFGRDILREVVDAFRAEGLRVGFYYSLLDWHHPDYVVDRHHPMYNNRAFREKAAGRDMNRYVEYMLNQIRELLTGYGPIDCLWLDYSFPEGKDGKGRNDWQSKRLLKLVRELQPQIIVDDRLDLDDVPEGWDFKTPEQFTPREGIRVNGKSVPWETCQTFGESWGYYRDEEGWKSPHQLIAHLVENVGKGGNLLLNIGPTGRGTIDERAKTRLEELGRWMTHNSRSIYGCTSAPDGFKVPDNTRLTYHPGTNRLYVHILSWPMTNLFLDGYAGKVRYAQFLHDASELRIGKANKPFQEKHDRIGEKVLILKLPTQKPDVAVPVIELILN